MIYNTIGRLQEYGLRKGRDLLVTFLAVAVSLMLTILHLDTIDAPHCNCQLELHNQIVSHTAPAPYQYRILQPAVAQAVLALSGHASSMKLFLAGYALLRFAGILLTLIFYYKFLRLHFIGTTAKLGVAIVAVVLPFTYRYYYYQPTSILELAAFAAALYYTARRAWLPVVVVVFLGTLNRETMIFVSVIWLLYWGKPSTRADWRAVMISVCVWAVVFAGVRALWPARGNLLDIAHYISLNLKNGRGQLDVFLATAPWAAWVFLRRRAVPAVFVRLAWFLVPWLALHLLTAQWWEVRYYLPSTLMCIPGLLVAVPSDSALPGRRLQPVQARRLEDAAR